MARSSTIFGDGQAASRIAAILLEEDGGPSGRKARP